MRLLVTQMILSPLLGLTGALWLIIQHGWELGVPVTLMVWGVSLEAKGMLRARDLERNNA